MPLPGVHRIGDGGRQRECAEAADAAGRLAAGNDLDHDLGNVADPRQAQYRRRAVRAAFRRPIRAQRRSPAPRPRSSPASICCLTRPGLIARPQSTAANRRWTLTLWSSPMLALATSPICDPNADAPAMPIVLPGPAAIPLGEPRRALQAACEPAVCAEHRHPERQRLDACSMRQLIDEAFGEEGQLALRRAAHVTGSNGTGTSIASIAHIRDRIRWHRAIERASPSLRRSSLPLDRASAEPSPSAVATRICHAAVIPPAPGKRRHAARARHGETRSWFWLARLRQHDLHRPPELRATAHRRSGPRPPRARARQAPGRHRVERDASLPNPAPGVAAHTRPRRRARSQSPAPAPDAATAQHNRSRQVAAIREPRVIVPAREPLSALPLASASSNKGRTSASVAPPENIGIGGLQRLLRGPPGLGHDRDPAVARSDVAHARASARSLRANSCASCPPGGAIRDRGEQHFGQAHIAGEAPGCRPPWPGRRAAAAAGRSAAPCRRLAQRRFSGGAGRRLPRPARRR